MSEPVPAERMIAGLERLYEGTIPDPWGGAAYPYNPKFDQSMELRAAEALYRAVFARKPAVVYEIGTCDGLSTCFLAKALIDADVRDGVVYTIEKAEQHRPWPALWEKLGVACRIVAVHGDAREEATWEKLPVASFAFFDGSHEAVDLRREVDRVLPRLRRPGTLVFHDAVISAEEHGFVQGLADVIGSPLGKVEWLDSCRGLALVECG